VHVFYLHGFASSPASGKATSLRERLAPLGLPLHVPDFNAPDFATLTTTRMLGQVEDAIRALEPGPVALVGSSLGGFLAIHAAARQVGGASHPITRLVLLAPAVGFGSGRDGWLTTAELDEWKRTDRRDVLHYADGKTYAVHYALWEDGQAHDAFAAQVHVPVLVFQGTRDTVVRPDQVREWVAHRSNATLCEVDDDHQLQSHLGLIWRECLKFLGLDPS
jgi:uncharacterized protein